MLVPSKYIKTQAERLNVLPAFIYVEREPDFVLAGPVKIYAQIYLQAPAE